MAVAVVLVQVRPAGLVLLAELVAPVAVAVEVPAAEVHRSTPAKQILEVEEVVVGATIVAKTANQEDLE